LPDECAAHVIHRAVETTFRTNALIPNLHATAFLAAQSSKRAKWSGALELLLREDLNSGFFPGARPPQHAAVLNRQVLKFKLFPKKFTRGRFEHERAWKDDVLSADLAHGLLRIFSGAWSGPTFQHYCWGSECQCCQDFETLIAICVALLERARERESDFASGGETNTCGEQMVPCATQEFPHRTIASIARRSHHTERGPHRELYGPYGPYTVRTIPPIRTIPHHTVHTANDAAKLPSY